MKSATEAGEVSVMEEPEETVVDAVTGSVPTAVFSSALPCFKASAFSTLDSGTTPSPSDFNTLTRSARVMLSLCKKKQSTQSF